MMYVLCRDAQLHRRGHVTDWYARRHAVCMDLITRANMIWALPPWNKSSIVSGSTHCRCAVDVDGHRWWRLRISESSNFSFYSWTSAIEWPDHDEYTYSEHRWPKVNIVGDNRERDMPFNIRTGIFGEGRRVEDLPTVTRKCLYCKMMIVSQSSVTWYNCGDGMVCNTSCEILILLIQ